MPLNWTDHREDPAAWAQELGVSVEACVLLLESDFIDAHCDTEVPVRLYGHQPLKRYPKSARPRIWFGHTDYHRIREASLTGVVYDIATNPLWPVKQRLRLTLSHVERIRTALAAHADEIALVYRYSGYQRARSEGKTAFWMSIQGGNALIHDLSVLDGPLGDTLHRITLVHLTSSALGGTSSPLGPDWGLTKMGAEFIEACNAKHILVDLAHAGRRTFWEALEVHDASLPPIVSHTGVAGVRDMWRNLDDRQLKAIADRGGVIGVMYQSNFLQRVLIYAERKAIVDHLEHICEVVGEDYACIGTDYDGMIIPPGDLPDITHHPLVVQDMLDRGWSDERIRKILGLNYLRVVREVRP